MPSVVWLPPVTEVTGMGLHQERKKFHSLPTGYFHYRFNLASKEFVEWGFHPDPVSESEAMGREGTCFRQGSLHVELFAGTTRLPGGNGGVYPQCHTHGCLLSTLLVYVFCFWFVHSCITASFKPVFCYVVRGCVCLLPQKNLRRTGAISGCNIQCFCSEEKGVHPA